MSSRSNAGRLQRYLVLPATALAIPVGITLATVVLFWTFPLSSLVALLLGVALGVLLEKYSTQMLAICAVPSIACIAWLYFFPLSDLGYGPALTQFIILNLVVFLTTLVAIRWKQGGFRLRDRHVPR